MTGGWRTSSFYSAGGCVEVAITPGLVQVRATGQDDALDFTCAETETRTEYRVMVGEHRVATASEPAGATAIVELPQFRDRTDVRVEARQVTTTTTRTAWTDTSTTNQPEESPDA